MSPQNELKYIPFLCALPLLQMPFDHKKFLCGGSFFGVFLLSTLLPRVQKTVVFLHRGGGGDRTKKYRAKKLITVRGSVMRPWWAMDF